MWILATVLGIFLFFILLLAIPIDLNFNFGVGTDFKSCVRMKWLFGLVGKDLYPGRGKKGQAKKGKLKQLKTLLLILRVLRVKGFAPRLAGFLRKVVRLLHIRQLSLDIYIGMPDPADTGMLLAIIGPTVVFMNLFSPVAIRIYPNFEQEVFSGHLKGNLRVVPIKLAMPSIRFLFSPTTIRAFKSMISACGK